MRDYLLTVLEQGGNLSAEEIVLYILSSAAISIAIYISYWFTHAGTAYSRKFNVSLITLTVLTGTVMTVIGNNVALSLGMVGALSIVRFRTAIKDSRDTAYIFWAIVVGICCGVGDYLVAGVGSAVVFLLLLLFGRVRNENRILLIVRAARSRELDVEGLIFRYFSRKALLKVKNTTADSVEFIYEMTRGAYRLSDKKEQSITQALYGLGDIEYVNVVTQSDEING